MAPATSVLESEVFPDSHQSLRSALSRAGHRLVDWDDDWWSDGFPLDVGTSPTFFHGSLGNAAEIASKLNWSPGSFCNASAFFCSALYESAHDWLLQSDWRILPANEFVNTAGDIAAELGCSGRVFVRPDSPLKPFSGRVIETNAATLDSLDYGFYYDDETLPVVVAPPRNVGCVWRFVVVRPVVVAGSAYDAVKRSPCPDVPESGAWSFAQSVAASLMPPAEVYVLDVCEADGDLRLLELNPFGGADLYACSAADVVRAVSELGNHSKP